MNKLTVIYLSITQIVLFFFSIIEFASRDDLQNVIDKLDDTELGGRRIRITAVSLKYNWFIHAFIHASNIVVHFLCKI